MVNNHVTYSNTYNLLQIYRLYNLYYHYLKDAMVLNIKDFLQKTSQIIDFILIVYSNQNQLSKYVLMKSLKYFMVSYLDKVFFYYEEIKSHKQVNKVY
jgi:hypothetical protein